MVDGGFFRRFFCSKSISQLLSLVSYDRMWSLGEREEERDEEGVGEENRELGFFDFSFFSNFQIRYCT